MKDSRMIMAGAVAALFLVVLEGTISHVHAKEMGFWDLMYWHACMVMEMCALRHPFGHQAWFAWDAPAVVGSSLWQWAAIVAGVSVGLLTAMTTFWLNVIVRLREWVDWVRPRYDTLTAHKRRAWYMSHAEQWAMRVGRR